MFKNSKKQGDYGTSCAIHYFCSKGFTVSVPLSDSQDYDLIVDIYNVLYKVQIKTTNYIRSKRDNYYGVHLDIKGGNSKSNFISKKANELNYDLLFVLAGNKDMWVIPRKIFKDYKAGLYLGPKWDKYKVLFV